MKALKEKADKLKPTPQRQAELKKKYGPQIDAVLKRMVPEAIRVQTIDGGPEALKALEGLK